MASYALLVVGSKKSQLRETYKYLIINLLGKVLFLLVPGQETDEYGNVTGKREFGRIGAVS